MFNGSGVRQPTNRCQRILTVPNHGSKLLPTKRRPRSRNLSNKNQVKTLSVTVHPAKLMSEFGTLMSVLYTLMSVPYNFFFWVDWRPLGGSNRRTDEPTAWGHPTVTDEPIVQPRWGPVKKLKEIGIYYDKDGKFFTTSKSLPAVKMHQTRDSKSLDFIHSNVYFVVTFNFLFGNTGTDVPWRDLKKNVVPVPSSCVRALLSREFEGRSSSDEEGTGKKTPWRRHQRRRHHVVLHLGWRIPLLPFVHLTVTLEEKRRVSE